MLERIKKTLLSPKMFFMSALLFFSALPAAAIDNDTIAPLAKDLGTPVTTIDGFFLLLTIIFKWLYSVLFIVAVLFIILAGYKFVFSKGDETKVQAAKQQVTWAVVAIAVGLVSMLIIFLINNFLNTGA